MNREVENALTILRKETKLAGRANSRVRRNDAKEDTVNRIRSLEQDCGGCANLKIEINNRGGMQMVSLRCTQGRSPLDLYRKTDLGQPSNCPDLVKNS